MDPDVIELTEVQREMLHLLAIGHDARGIAVHLGWSRSYAYDELRVLRGELDTSSNTAAVVEAVRRGLISMPTREELLPFD